jgi:hypothetical protein
MSMKHMFSLILVLEHFFQQCIVGSVKYSCTSLFDLLSDICCFYVILKFYFQLFIATMQKCN